MKTFNISSQNIYVVGCHGCAPPRLHNQEKDFYPEKRYFNVPENIMIVYLNSNGVLSEGRKNIPFLKNLYDYNKMMFNYIFNPENYKINMDKTNPNSYRNKDFFKSFPFFSDFNYLCNFELYPPGVLCPVIQLSFSIDGSHGKPVYFEGITSLDNINFQKYGQILNFNDPKNVLNPSQYISVDKNIYTSDFINVLNKNFGIKSGVFFISACRAEYFIHQSKPTLIYLNPVDRKCQDIKYDIDIIDNLIKLYPVSKDSLENVKKRLIVRNNKKNNIDEIIITSYLQQLTNYYNRNFILELYNLLLVNILEKNIVMCVNFEKINISKKDFDFDLEYPYSIKNYLIQLINAVFIKIRINLIISLEFSRKTIIENNNKDLYEKLGYLYRFTFEYAIYYSNLPTFDYFKEFYDLIEKVYNPELTREDITLILNQHIRRFNISIKTSNIKSNYKEKYLKYKQKYLKLKNE